MIGNHKRPFECLTNLSLEVPCVPDLAQQLPCPLHHEGSAALVVLGLQEEIPVVGFD